MLTTTRRPRLVKGVKIAFTYTKANGETSTRVGTLDTIKKRKAGIVLTVLEDAETAKWGSFHYPKVADLKLVY
jgi:hypothetical protein